MENRLYNLIAFLITLCISYTAFGQGNPGFLGKKIAIGYNKQYCLLRSDNIFGTSNNSSLAKILTNNDYYVEYSVGKYKSIAAHFLHQKVTIDHYSHPSSDIGQVIDNGVYRFRIDNGYAEFNSMALGVRYSVFSQNKTISSPVGLSQYFRADLYVNQLIKNNFIYFNTDGDMSALTKLDRSIKTKQTMNISLGYGGETKYLLTQSLFIRLNAEMNISSTLFKKMNEDSYYSSSDYQTVDEDMSDLGKEVNLFRNMFLLGFGIGVIL